MASTKLRLGIYDLGRQGGSTRYLKDLLKGLPPNQYEIIFFPPQAATTYLGTDSHDPHSIPPTESKPHNSSAGRLWRCLPRSCRLAIGLVRETIVLSRQIRRQRVDLFHSNYAGFEIAPIAARLAGIKKVVGIYHNLPSEGYITNRWVQWFFENLSGWSVTVPVAVSKSTATEWEVRCRSLRGRFQTIYNGINVAEIEAAAHPALTRAELDLAGDAKILAVAARLHPMKGIGYLIEAMPAILARHPQTILLLVGDGPERTPLEQQARKLDRPDTVRFLGWRDDAPRVLALADVVVLPSVNLETFGYALTEAMVLRKPLVATDVGGLPEVVEHGKTGYIVPRRNSPALAEAIIRLLDNPAQSAEFGDAGRQRVETVFPIHKMQQQTITLYEKLLTKAR